MKTRLLIIIGILITFTITFFILGPSQGHIAEYFLTEEQFQDLVLGDNPHVVDSIDGFVINDISTDEVVQYPLNKLDEIPCRDFMRLWHEDFRAVEEHEILIEKYDICFEETFGGLGNRHPAFLGYYIPDICTNDMIKHLVKHSNMFFADEENFSLEWIGLPNSINKDNYDVCLDELLENRDNEPSWPGR